MSTPSQNNVPVIRRLTRTRWSRWAGDNDVQPGDQPGKMIHEPNQMQLLLHRIRGSSWACRHRPLKVWPRSRNGMTRALDTVTGEMKCSRDWTMQSTRTRTRTKIGLWERALHRASSTVAGVLQTPHSGAIIEMIYVHFRSGKERSKFGPSKYLHICRPMRQPCFSMWASKARQRKNWNGATSKRSMLTMECNT